MRKAILYIFSASLLPSVATAQLSFCNKTNKDIQVAVSQNKMGDVWSTEGWFTFAPSACGNVIGGSLKNRYYYFYAKRTDGKIWEGNDTNSSSACVRQEAFELTQRENCSTVGAGGRQVRLRKIDTGDSNSYTVNITSSEETVSFTEERNLEKACQILQSNLNRPQLRSHKITIGHYTDLLTPPQTKSECTNIRDTGVPDPATCTTRVDNCASKWHGPFGSWGCIPGTTTSCTNIKVCDTYAHYKKTMECDVTFQLKLPNYIERPIDRYLDNTFSIVEKARAEISTALPLACVPENIRQTTPSNPGQALAEAIGKEIERRVRARIEKEAREWLQETAIQTIAAAIPSGGIGGGAVMSTKLATFAYRVHRAVKPVLAVANDVKNFAEDIGFSTSCGWNDWHRW